MGRLMEHDDIDRIFGGEDEILPSSGFAVSVMDAVRREAAAPPPIPFPWKWALPGLVVGALVLTLILIVGVLAVARAAPATTPQFSMPWSSLPSTMPLFFHGGIESAAVWIALGLLVALVSVKLSMRLASAKA